MTNKDIKNTPLNTVHPLMKKTIQNPQSEYDSAFVQRPFLSLSVVCLWIGITILVVMSFMELMFLKYKSSLNLFLVSLLLFFIWFCLHKWAMKNPKTN
jgi:uncharacterized membrane protein